MIGSKLSAVWPVVLSALMMPSIHAQDQEIDPFGADLMPVTSATDEAAPALSSQPASYRKGQFDGQAPMAIDANLGGGGGVAPQQQPGYAYLGAPMYPCPRPNIPIWTGSTMITNQALAPHEMLYPHTYRAMYPPYYHRVKGHWLLTPLGVRSHEKWELQGTMVQVKYRSAYPGLLSGAGWHPPATSYMHGAWR
ncbi:MULTISPECIES: hypothetical protein [unclassified Schlesneria]|uniref:hypothetical protein n=1 Tax=Schlesneria TaxID=656899 RepID=UPI002F12CC25